MIENNVEKSIEKNKKAPLMVRIDPQLRRRLRVFMAERDYRLQDAVSEALAYWMDGVEWQERGD